MDNENNGIRTSERPKTLRPNEVAKDVIAVFSKHECRIRDVELVMDAVRNLLSEQIITGGNNNGHSNPATINARSGKEEIRQEETADK